MVDELEKIFIHFLWQEDRVLALSWEVCCQPLNKGGFGIRRIMDCNVMGLLKYFWYVASSHDAPWVAWMPAKYLKYDSVWEAPLAQCPSWVWRGILSIRHIAENLMIKAPFQAT